jgi:hypothetical protein
MCVCLKRSRIVYKYDLSLPIAKFYDLVEVMRERFAQKYP